VDLVKISKVDVVSVGKNKDCAEVAMPTLGKDFVPALPIVQLLVPVPTEHIKRHPLRFAARASGDKARH
jgi:hypothetical protein